MNQTHIPMIAITGGPCGGKTTILSFLQKKLADIGFAVIIINEAATEFMLSGLTPKLIDACRFQQQLIKYIIEKEDRWKEAASFAKTDKIVILCDRGVIDAAAYVFFQEFDLTLSELGYNFVDLRDQRYDAVIFLRSVAVDAPEVYTLANNAARSEGTEDAKIIDAKTLAAWTGHPDLQIIDNSTGIEEKSHRAFRAVCRVLGVSVPIEIASQTG